MLQLEKHMLDKLVELLHHMRYRNQLLELKIQHRNDVYDDGGVSISFPLLLYEIILK